MQHSDETVAFINEGKELKDNDLHSISFQMLMNNNELRDGVHDLMKNDKNPQK